jgi:hypothetical protein
MAEQDENKRALLRAIKTSAEIAIAKFSIIGRVDAYVEL